MIGIKTRIKTFLSPFPVVMNILRILQDKRYMYHIFQGKFTSVTSRKKLRQIEKIFYSKRVSLKDHYNEETLEIGDLSSFATEGIILNPITISKFEAQTVRESLKNFLCHDPENNELGYFNVDDKPEGVLRAYYKCEDLVKIPFIISIANHPKILAYVSQYFGALPSIDSIYAWWSFPSSNKALTQSFHRDIDTLHAIKFFIYLSDVELDSGPHIYVKKSMNSDLITKKDKSHLDEEIEEKYLKGDILNITGESGFNFLGDTFSFHKGLTPASKPRLLLQIYYSLKSTPFGPKNPFIEDKALSSFESDETTKLVNKNIISFS